MKRADSLKCKAFVSGILVFFNLISFPSISNAALFTFTSHTFTSCSATGYSGPTQAGCRSAYATTWDESDSNFTVANGIQKWTVPASGKYRIKAIGSVGGGYSGGNYGYGASIQGELDLAQGDVLSIVVGQQGLDLGGGYGQGGGGGSFVIKGASTPLVIAGGGGSMSSGGGDAGSSRTARACGDASLTTSGMAGCYYSGTPGDGFGAAGTNGSAGGAVVSSWNGYPGSGFLGDASVGAAKSWANGMLGGNLTTYGVGGFGGGGSAGMYGGSGGGGYSGGGASARHSHGGGGGSYNAGTNKVEGLNNAIAPGSVIITLIAVAISDTTTSLSVPNSLAFRTASTLVATTSVPGRVTFLANGKRIGGCISIATVGSSPITATCNFKPATRIALNLSVSFTPSDTSSYRSSSATSGLKSVSNRSGNR
jgi:hypothetical protein